MTTASAQYKVPMAFIGSVWGLVCALILFMLPLLFPTQPFLSKLDVIPRALVFASVYAMPFVLALTAQRWGGLVQRVTALASAALLAVLLSFTSMSLTILICPAAPLLIVGTVRVAHGLTVRQLALAVGGMVVLVLLGVSAFFSLISVSNDGVCYQHTRGVDGRDVWQAVPYSNSATVGGANGVIGVTCVSDTLSPGELLRAAALLGLFAGVWVAIGPLERRLQHSMGQPS